MEMWIRKNIMLLIWNPAIGIVMEILFYNDLKRDCTGKLL